MTSHSGHAMPSLRSRLIAFYLRRTRKQAFSSPEAINAWVRWARTRQSHRPPDWLRQRLHISEWTLDGMPVYEVEPLKTTSPRRILYMHGGAYLFEISRYHWHLIGELAERVGARITVPIYPLAPEHTFPAIFDPVEALYRSMQKETPAEHIVFMGDSAGANMAVVLTMMAARDGLPKPGRHVLISPGLDMSLTNPAVFEMEAADPWLSIPGGLEAIRLYAPGMDRTDWRISPIYGDLSVLPPTLVVSGSMDMLNPDTVLFVEKARAAGVSMELMVEPGMFHVFPLIDMPEARRARNRIVEFLQKA